MVNISQNLYSQIILYQSPDGQTKIEVKLQDETVWLTQEQMVQLFQTTKQNISLHIKNIFKEEELEENSVVKEYLTTAKDGKISHEEMQERVKAELRRFNVKQIK